MNFSKKVEDSGPVMKVDDYRFCDDCHCIIHKDDVKRVKGGFGGYNYCWRCKPPYDTIHHPGMYGLQHDQPVKYYKNDVECDEKGNVIEKKK